jgi:hypothetical protein
MIRTWWRGSSKDVRDVLSFFDDRDVRPDGRSVIGGRAILKGEGREIVHGQRPRREGGEGIGRLDGSASLSLIFGNGVYGYMAVIIFDCCRPDKGEKKTIS